jgi:hypothetical protein
MENKTTWNPKGEKHISTVRMDEKRAFTLVLTISASGKLLPMQTIYFGQIAASCPYKRLHSTMRLSTWGSNLNHRSQEPIGPCKLP